MFAVEMLGRTIRGDILHLTMPPDIPPLLDVDVAIGTAEDDDFLHLSVSLERMIDILLQGDELAASVPSVGGDDHLGSGVGEAILDAIRTKTSENNAMDSTDPRTGEHRDGGLRNQRHVDEDAIPIFNAVTLENVGKLAHLAVKLAVSDDLFVTRLTLPDNGGLVGAGCLEVTVEAILCGIQLCADKPLGIGELPIKDLGPLFEPMKFFCLTSPEFVGALDRLGM